MKNTPNPPGRSWLNNLETPWDKAEKELAAIRQAINAPAATTTLDAVLTLRARAHQAETVAAQLWSHIDKAHSKMRPLVRKLSEPPGKTEAGESE